MTVLISKLCMVMTGFTEQEVRPEKAQIVYAANLREVLHQVSPMETSCMGHHETHWYAVLTWQPW